MEGKVKNSLQSPMPDLPSLTQVFTSPEEKLVCIWIPMATVPGGPTISCPHKCEKIWGPPCLGKLLFKDIAGWPLPLQRVNEGPERGGVVPQTTRLMQGRVVAFQLPAVLPEGTRWAGTCFCIAFWQLAVCPVPLHSFLLCSCVCVSLGHTWPADLALFPCRCSLWLQVPFPGHHLPLSLQPSWSALLQPLSHP